MFLVRFDATEFAVTTHFHELEPEKNDTIAYNLDFQRENEKKLKKFK